MPENSIREQKKTLLQEFRDESRERALGYIVGAFGLVAGLAWNDAIRGLIEQLFPVSQSTVVAKFIYALIITILLVAAVIFLNRLFKKRV